MPEESRQNHVDACVNVIGLERFHCAYFVWRFGLVDVIDIWIGEQRVVERHE